MRGGGLEKGLTGRPPTGAEHRAMALLAVVHGAQGLLHRGYAFAATTDREEYVLPRDAADLWEGMQGTNALLKQLAEPLACGTYRGARLTGALHVGAWEFGGRLYVLAVNARPAAALTTFSVPGESPAVLKRLEDGSTAARTANGQFADDLPPYGARAYVADLARP